MLTSFNRRQAIAADAAADAMVAKPRSGQSIPQVVSWAKNEIQRFVL